MIAKICHQLKPITLSSSGNQMFIEFSADYSYQGKGFTANYSSIPTSTYKKNMNTFKMRY